MILMSEIKPYRDSSAGKGADSDDVRSVVPKYDFLNHTLSFGIDKLWRKKAIRLIFFELSRDYPGCCYWYRRFCDRSVEIGSKENYRNRYLERDGCSRCRKGKGVGT